MGNKPILLVDALNFFMRHFTVNPTISKNGAHIGGVMGFLKGIQLLIDNLKPHQVVVCWEGGGSPRRRSIFPEYKNNKRPVKLNRFYSDDIPDTIENRNYQVNFLVSLLKLSGLNQVYAADCEADDAISYLAKYKFKDRDVVIVSSDKDYYQLLNGDRIKQWSPGQKDFVELDKILKKFFIPAHNFCVARCFCGDGSDGIPGIKGAGFKTLAKRFPELCSGEFVSVDEILILNAERLLSSKVQLFHNIDQNQEIPRRNWKLMYLDIKNLSSSQINKIENQVDTFDSVLNKIKFIKLLTREGVENFDFNTFLMTTKSIQ